MNNMQTGQMITLYTGEVRRAHFGTVAVDPQKIKKIITDRRLMMKDISKTMGFGGNTLSGAICSGLFSGPMVQGLKTYFNINPEDYEYKPEEKSIEEEKPESEKPVAVEESAMYTVMKMAVLDALNECLAGNMKNLRGMVMTAIQQAKNLA